MRSVALAAAALAAGCGTFGVDVVEREVKASHPADGIAAVLADLTVEDQVRARGGAAAIDATLSVVAWIEPGASAELLDRVTIGMEEQSPGQLAIDPDIKGAATERIVATDLELLLPATLALALDVSHGAIEVSDLAGAIDIDAPDSAVSAERTGPVDIEAHEVSAEIGGGGRIAASGLGAVTVTVLGSDFDQLEVTSEEGPVAIHLPPGRGWDIELSTGGEATARVDLGGLSCGGADIQSCDVTFGAGGPLIRVESSGGAITVDDLL